MIMKIVPKHVLAAVLILLLLSPAAHAQSLNVADVAREIAKGVGTVGETSAGMKGPVFVFEEYHTSRVGQLQIAIMLLRLHNRYGVKKVGLEGAVQRPRPLDGTWFHNISGQSAREDVAVRMLAEGEISAAEFVTLVFPDMQVYGTELQDQYKVKLDVEGSPEISYLLAIAVKLLTQADIQKVDGLIRQDKKKEAIEYLLTRDPWVRQQYEARKDSSPRSLDQMAKQAREIQNKARELGVTVNPEVKQEMEKVLQFYEVASKRSTTMVDYVLNLPGVASGAPVAVSIGAGHTQQVIEFLRSRKAAFAQITPLALNPSYGELSIEQFERKNNQKWARTNLGTLGFLLNTPRKPPPIIETASGKGYGSMVYAALIAARAARAGRQIPDDLWEELASLPELRIDRSSFTRDGYDVIFRAWPKTTDGGEKEVWVRVGTLDTQEEAKSLEEKLFQAIADLGGGGRIPPRKPPPDSENTENEGPGDGKRGEFLISRIGPREVAVFAATRDNAMKVGRLSG